MEVVNSMKNVKFFVGKEVEGTIHKGKLTLFVVGDQPIDRIYYWLGKIPGITHVYFGAAGQSKVTNFDTLKEIASSRDVTYEFNLSDIKLIPDDILGNNFILKLINLNQLGKNVSYPSLKIEKEDGVFIYNDHNYNNWNAYGDDKILE